MHTERRGDICVQRLRQPVIGPFSYAFVGARVPWRVDDIIKDDTISSSDEERARVLAPIFFPSLPPTNQVCQDAVDFAWRTHRPLGPNEVELMTHSDLLKSIRSMRSGATPGIDGLLGIYFKKCAITLLPHLLRIFNGCSAMLAARPLLLRIVCTHALFFDSETQPPNEGLTITDHNKKARRRSNRRIHIQSNVMIHIKYIISSPN